MKYIIILIALFVSKVSAQDIYKVVYANSVPYNLDPYKEILSQNSFSLSILDSNKKIYKEYNRFIASNMLYVGYCSNEKNIYYDSFMNDGHIPFKYSASHFMEINGSVNLFSLEFHNKLKRLIVHKTDGYISGCLDIDTSKLNFVKTNNTKQIDSFYCNEYLLDNNGDKIGLWVTNELKPFINPRIFGNNLPGGVVEAVFYKNKATIKLIFIEKVNKYQFPDIRYSDCNNKNGFISDNILDNIFIRGL